MLLALVRECALELRFGDQSELHEQLPERPPGQYGLDVGRLRLLRRLVLACLQLDAMLFGQDAGERESGQIPVVDEDLAKETTATRLLGERLLELFLRQ